MNEHHGSRVIAGFAILAGIIALATLLFFLAFIIDAFREDYSIVAIFPTSEGLRVGSPVWIAGHEVGTVATIGFRPVIADSAPTVAVRINLPTEHQSQVRRDSHIRLTRPRPVGDPVINITPGSPGSPPLQEGDTLFGLGPPTVEAAIAAMARFRFATESLLVQSRRFTPIAARGKQQLALVVDELDDVRSELADVRRSFERPGARNVTDPQVRVAFANLAATAKQLGPLFGQAAQRYQDPALRQAFSSLQQRSSSLSAQFDSMSAVLMNGSLSRFAQDSAIMKALHAAQVELDSVMAITKRNPMRFWLGDR